jgi:hypothetical protein
MAACLFADEVPMSSWCAARTRQTPWKQQARPMPSARDRLLISLRHDDDSYLLESGASLPIIVRGAPHVLERGMPLVVKPNE